MADRSRSASVLALECLGGSDGKHQSWRHLSMNESCYVFDDRVNYKGHPGNISDVGMQSKFGQEGQLLALHVGKSFGGEGEKRFKGMLAVLLMYSTRKSTQQYGLIQKRGFFLDWVYLRTNTPKQKPSQRANIE